VIPQITTSGPIVRIGGGAGSKSSQKKPQIVLQCNIFFAENVPGTAFADR
jgi:hypothetical protein